MEWWADGLARYPLVVKTWIGWGYCVLWK